MHSWLQAFYKQSCLNCTQSKTFQVLSITEVDLYPYTISFQIEFFFIHSFIQCVENVQMNFGVTSITAGSVTLNAIFNVIFSAYSPRQSLYSFMFLLEHGYDGYSKRTRLHMLNGTTCSNNLPILCYKDDHLYGDNIITGVVVVSLFLFL